MIWIIGIGIFLFLLFAFPRQTGVTIGSLVAIVAVIVAYFYIQDQAEKSRVARVAVQATYGGALCTDPNFPLLLVIHNGSDRTFAKLSIDVFANREGYSDSLVFENIYSDKIMQPNENYSACWSVGDYQMKTLKFPAPTLNWKAVISFVTWQ